ncbi:hypothetical protein BWI17_05915 [Betaproteobacteria bacterium GR16-43]|nr:hypothetical protein BWI17_05915 [Betaproteobacteria bacterium GR16-43]
MRTALASLALLAATASMADTLQPLQAASSAAAANAAQATGHQARLYQRYCDKLREGPEAYAAFVRRMNVVTGYTYTEFAPTSATDPVRYQCREGTGALAQR